MSQSADRALQIAIEMERLGQTFYRSLAEGCGNAAIAALAIDLAREEKQHVVVFERMLGSLPPMLRGPKLKDEELIEAAKELRVKIMPGATTVRDVALEADLSKALDMAIEMEEQAVAFYTGKALVVTGVDSLALMRIVEEEKKHLASLQNRRNRLPLEKNNVSF